METTRQNKISRLLQKELSDIFLAETRKTHGIIISVSVVRVSPDLSTAKAYLSIFPPEKSAEMIENINANTKTIRYELSQRVRYQLRKTPELSFFLDDSLDYRKHRFSTEKVNAPYEPPRPENSMALLVFKKIA